MSKLAHSRHGRTGPGRAGPIIIDKMKELLSELVRTELASPESGSAAQAAPPEIDVRFVVGAYMSVVTWWLDRDARETPEEIDQAFRDLALGGLGTLLRPKPWPAPEIDVARALRASGATAPGTRPGRLEPRSQRRSSQ
ncbi:TetR-like C-terminal domain-containing protein [Phenylobacterium sp.]|uniref:TetR-like C-terminal domain-containing protein n=1 Tax=Phenylobacterium sp. TaxID=1871053 RepID=UPI002FC8D60A